MKHHDKVVDYLRWSYQYYILNEPTVPDVVYDRLCKFLLDVYDEIESPYRHLVKKSSLRAGTGYQIRATEYPKEIVNQ